MATTGMTMGNDPLWRRLRWLAWAGAACLLLLPLVAMQFTREVQWTATDFMVMGGLLALACGALELAVRVARNHAYVLGACIAVALGFFTTWINLAVGIVGEPGNPANLAFFGVLAVALLGAAIARLRAQGMARAMAVAALAQVAAGAVALAQDSREGVILSAVFVALWLASAWLFGKAARQEAAFH